MSVNRKNTNIELMGQSQNNHKSTHFRHEFDDNWAQDCSDYSRVTTVLHDAIELMSL